MNLLYFLFIFLCVSSPQAQAKVNVEKLADAIKVSEASKSHPYGIMQRYKRTTPRQACINTIKHAIKDYRGNDSGFIEFLGKRYAPIGAKNDPTNLNKNWTNNVQAIYARLLSSKNKKKTR